MYAALQLYLLTGQNGPDADHAYRDIFETAAATIVGDNDNAPFPDQYQPGNRYSTCQTAHFISYLLDARTKGTNLATTLKNKIQSEASKAVPGDYPYPHPRPERELKLGTGSGTGQFADVFMYAYLFDTGANKQRDLNIVSRYADYALGLNPLGMTFYTGLKEFFVDAGPAFAGLGQDEPQSPCHQDSYFTNHKLGDHAGDPVSIGNVPGILVYGPSVETGGSFYETAIANQIYPDFGTLPVERRWGDGWSIIALNEFATWENMIWNVPMFGFLYDAGGTPPTPDTTVPSAPRRLRRGP